ncbi:hypothetical protein GCM10027055_21430 [Janibacter alkaliphilus]|uniref:DUF4233 domain-containing protein n=1 Tax=Janibacter alkaliphilus TaxID=1069963 RepID=A0A852X6L2_9MICO|nr:DUF4233 domain-containing protein [Janibacter alkaliphilus]NYG38549.1 hypothetical protein [Janibacter alkaliphilus]
MRAPGKFTWRMLATVLGGQALVIFFGALVARGLRVEESSDLPLGLTPFVVMCAVAVLALLAAGMVRRPGGPVLGWVVQGLTLLSAIWVPTMLAIAVVFGALYGYCQWQGTKIDARTAAAEAGPASQ